MVRKISKKWLMRSGIFSAIVGATLVVGVACGGGEAEVTDEEFAALTARVTALQALADMIPADFFDNPMLPGTGGGDLDRFGETLDTIIERGNLICGVQSATPGFGTLERVGHDVDYCRAVTAAIFGEVTDDNLEYVNATGDNRFQLLMDEDIDLLVHTTTWTSGRDTDLQAAFTATTFYDGAGIMISRALADTGIVSARQLGGRTICVLSGTSTLDALNDFAEINNITWTINSGPDQAPLLNQFQSGTCDGYSSDQSQLAGFRSGFENFEAVILPDLLSKEPLGPSVKDGDAEFKDLVQWINFYMITAEEEGITQANWRQQVALGRDGLTPTAGRILGVRDDVAELGGGKLENGLQFFRDVLEEVGNYGEVYARHLEPIGLARNCSANQLWLTTVAADCNGDGETSVEENRGVIYAPRVSG